MNYNFSIQHLQKSYDSLPFRQFTLAHTRWSAGTDPYPPDRFRPPGERHAKGTIDELGGTGTGILF